MPAQTTLGSRLPPRTAVSRVAPFVVAAVGLAGAALVVLRAPPPASSVDASALRFAVEGRLRETAAGLHARVATLGELPRLAAAVATDARTVRDLTDEELAFRPRRGETVGIAQILGGGKVNVLLVLPDGARPPPFTPGDGATAAVTDGALVLSETVRVAPRERAHLLVGAAAASWEVPLADLAAQTTAAGALAWIEGPGGKAHLAATGAGARAPAQGRRIEVALEGRPGRGLRLVVLAPGGGSPARRWTAAALLAVAALLAAVMLRWAARPPVGAAAGAGLSASALPVAPLPAGPASSSDGYSRQTGRRIGRYEVLSLIGTGGIAEVYLARSHGEAGFQKLVALKVLQPAVARQPQLVEDFLDEARLASMLDHPNVVQIIDLGRADDSYYIAMEFVEGGDLARLIEITRRHGRPVPVAVALLILRQVCNGLNAAHTATVKNGAEERPLEMVHRDVKSANVFVARNGAVKVGDFGIAKATHAVRLRRTEVGQTKGTPGYMAPEQRLGQPVDARADLYGVGAIAYELLSGVEVNLDLAALFQRGTAGWPHLTPLSELRGDVPPELERAIFRALAYERADRFADCAAFEAVLEAIAARHTPGASQRMVATWVESTLAEDAASSREALAELLRA